jgi:hypothetical protein
MMLLFVLLSLDLSCGIEAGYAAVGDFNEHLAYLTERANGLGWTGAFGSFDRFKYSPVLQCGLFAIENFSADIDIAFFYDQTGSDFGYSSAADTLHLTETWRYFSIPMKTNLCLDLGPVTFISGFVFTFTRLDISARANYPLSGSYPKNYSGMDMGMTAGLRKNAGRVSFSLFFRLARLDEFHRQDIYLYYLEPEGYIYEGEKVENSHSAALDFSGGGVRILYRIF